MSTTTSLRLTLACGDYDINRGLVDGTIQPEAGGIQVVDAHRLSVEIVFEGVPGVGLGLSRQNVRAAVVVEVEGPDGLAEQGLEGVEVLLGSGLQPAEAVVRLREEEDEPDGDDLTQGQFAHPKVVGGEVTIPQFSDAQALPGGPENGEVIHPFDTDQLRGCGAHPAVLLRQTHSENPTFS